MSVDIVICDASYVDAVHNLENEIFADPYSIATLTKDFSNPSGICFCAVSDGEVCGYCICSSVLDEAELQRIAVSGKYRKQGIASKLIDYLLKICASKNIEYIFLEVRESNSPARGLYEKYNFEMTGVRKAYYRDNGENAVLYALSLNRR